MSILFSYLNLLCNILQEKAAASSAKGEPRHHAKTFSFRVRGYTIATQETTDNLSSQSGAYWLKHARGISARLIKVVTRTPRRFLDHLCYSFPKSKMDSLFTNPRNELERLRKALHRCERVVLNTYGCSEEFREVEEINKTVKLMEDWLDDILMVLLEGKDIEREHRSGHLLYQQDKDFVLKPSSKSV